MRKLSEEASISKKSIKSAYWIYVVIGLVIYLVLFYTLKPFEVNIASQIENIVFIILAAGASILFAIVSRQFNWLKTKAGQMAFFLMIGFILWLIAESIWFSYELSNIEPFPSPADVFWIAGYIPFAIALVLNITGIKVKFKPAILALWITLSILMFVIILFIEIIPFVVEELSIDTFITLIYPLEDLAIVVLVLVILLKFRAGEIAKPWALLTVGFIVTAVGDIWFTYADWYETYGISYNWVDFFLALGYVLFIGSALYFIWLYKKR